MDTNETLAQKALRLLNEVPSDEFITGDYTDKVGKCCAIGHLERLTKDPSDYSNKNCYDNTTTFGYAVRTASTKFIKEKHNTDYACIAEVNNKPRLNGYTEPVIKDRVIHLLKDMVAEGY